jgi:hypothetical protein
MAALGDLVSKSARVFAGSGGGRSCFSSGPKHQKQRTGRTLSLLLMEGESDRKQAHVN